MGQDIAQVFLRVDVEHATGSEQAIEDGGGLSGVGAAEKEPVLFAHSGFANSVFDEIIVDFQMSVAGIDDQVRPKVQGQRPVGDRLFMVRGIGAVAPPPAAYV